MACLLLAALRNQEEVIQMISRQCFGRLVAAFTTMGCMAMTGGCSSSHGDPNGANASRDTVQPTVGTYRLYADFSVTNGARSALRYTTAEISPGSDGIVLTLTYGVQEGASPSSGSTPRIVDLSYAGPETDECGQTFEGTDNLGSVVVTDRSSCTTILQGLLTVQDSDGSVRTSDDITPNSAFELGVDFREIVPSGDGLHFAIDGESATPATVSWSLNPSADPITIGSDYSCQYAIDSITCTSPSRSPQVSVTRTNDGHFTLTVDGAVYGQNFSHVLY